MNIILMSHLIYHYCMKVTRCGEKSELHEGLNIAVYLTK